MSKPTAKNLFGSILALSSDEEIRALARHGLHAVERFESRLAKLKVDLETRDKELLAYLCEDDNLPTYERGYADGRKSSKDQLQEARDDQHAKERELDHWKGLSLQVTETLRCEQDMSHKWRLAAVDHQERALEAEKIVDELRHTPSPLCDCGRCKLVKRTLESFDS